MKLSAGRWLVNMRHMQVVDIEKQVGVFISYGTSTNAWPRDICILVLYLNNYSYLQLLNVPLSMVVGSDK